MRSGSRIHWSGYPSLLAAGGFAAGIVLGGRWGGAGVFFWLGVLGVGFAGFGLAHVWDQRRLVSLAPLGRVVAAGVVVVGAGGLRHAVYKTPGPDALGPVVDQLGDASVPLAGTVRGSPERAGEGARFTLSVDTIGIGQSAAAVAGRVRVTLRSPPWEDDPRSFPEVRQGDEVWVRGAVRPGPEQRNPGGFDYGAYLEQRGVCCVTYIGDPENVEIRQRARGAVAVVGAVREYVRRQVDRYVLAEGNRGVLQALLLGDRGGITETQRENFARTGLMHLLAVSGLHVFLVGMVLYGLLRPALVRLRVPWWRMEVVRAVGTIGVLGFYMVLTGGRPSVVRAVVMAALFIGGVVFQRSSHPLNTLGMAALLLLAVRPTALCDVGFQLSMAAVAGILVLQPRLAALLPEEWRRSFLSDGAVSITVASGAAILGTTPVLLYHFGWVSVAGLVLNTVGIPCTGLVLSAGIAMVATGGVSSVAGGAFGGAVDFFGGMLLITAQEGAAWLSWAGLRMAEPDAWALGALVLGLLAIAQWPRPRVRWRCVGVGVLLAAMSVWIGVLKSGSSLDVIFFDVGHGDAILVSTPDNRHLLVDTGPWSPGGAAAEYSVVPFLERHGIRRLDVIVVTHSDADHLGGLSAIGEEVSVGTVVHNGRSRDTELYRRVRENLEERNVSTEAIGRGEAFWVGRGLRVEVLSPPGSEAFESGNNMSVVTRVSYGGVSLLFPGDVEAEAERSLVRSYGSSLRSHLVAVPHHGSRTSSTPDFVEAVADEAWTHSVVSAGRENRYGLPHEEPISRWIDESASVHGTMRGAVWLRTDGREVWRRRWR